MSTVYVLGAGASVLSGAPVLKNFFSHVFSTYGPHSPRINRVAAFLTDFFGVSLDCPGGEMPKYDTVLTFIDLALNSKRALDAKYHERVLLQLRDDLIYLLWLSLQGTAAPEEPDSVHRDFVEKLVTKDDSILSLNYDLLVDKALYARYGHLDYGLRFKETFATVSGGKDVGPPPPLLKLHGSLNWLVCPTCQNLYLYLGRKALARIFEEPAELCPADESYLKGILIPPTWIKDYGNAHMQQVWMAAETRLREAKRVVFIGYSLAATDVQVLFSLCRALHSNRHKPLIEVVNPERRDVIHRRYRRMFGSVSYHCKTFEEWLEQVTCE